MKRLQLYETAARFENSESSGSISHQTIEKHQRGLGYIYKIHCTLLELAVSSFFLHTQHCALTNSRFSLMVAIQLRTSQPLGHSSDEPSSFSTAVFGEHQLEMTVRRKHRDEVGHKSVKPGMVLVK